MNFPVLQEKSLMTALTILHLGISDNDAWYAQVHTGIVRSV